MNFIEYMTFYIQGFYIDDIGGLSSLLKLMEFIINQNIQSSIFI